jgi:FkbM family methyltransferase
MNTIAEDSVARRPALPLKARIGLRIASLLHRIRMTHHVRTPLLRAAATTGIFRMTRPLESGLRLVLEVDDKVQLEICRKGTWERGYLELAFALLRPGDVFVDVGAHCGYFAASVAHGRRECRVLAFEPNPRVRRLLEATRDLNRLDNLTVDDRAVSDSSRDMDFWVSPGAYHSLGSLLPRSRANRRTVIRGVALADALREHEIREVRVLMLDIEGAEALVLPSSAPLLREGAVHALMLELHVDLVEQCGKSAEALLAVLEECGFRVYNIRPSSLTPLGADWRGQVGGSRTIHIAGLHRSVFPADVVPEYSSGQD